MLWYYLRWRYLCKTLARKCGRRELAAGIRGIFSIFHSSIFSISAQCTSAAGGDLSCTALSNTSGWNIIFAKRLWQPETFFCCCECSNWHQRRTKFTANIVENRFIQCSEQCSVGCWMKVVEVCIQIFNKAQGTLQKSHKLTVWSFEGNSNIAC